MHKTKGKILIVDDNEEILKALKYYLEDYFELVITEKNPNHIPSCLKKHNFDLFILDMNFRKGENSGNEGIFWMQQIQKNIPGALIIFITAYGDIELSVKAIKMGATDFIQKPWDDNKLLSTVLSAYKLKQSRDDAHKSTPDETSKSCGGQLLLGKSESMKKVWETIQKVSQTNANVLITGENGTGKGLVAKEIHNQSLRKDKAFVQVDIGSISETLFESELFGHVKGAFTDAKDTRTGYMEEANEGTLFLDEIANIPVHLQAKLLTAIQNREVAKIGSTEKISLDIRLISATNKNLNEMVSGNSFREDLLYRLNTIQIELPPLRERQEDIVILFNHFLKSFSENYNKPILNVSSKIFDNLKKYSWPGNIRELEHLVEKAVILSAGNKLNLDDFIFPGQKIEMPNSLKIEEHEKQLIIRALKKSKGNLSKAAEELGIARKTLYNKMSKHGI